MEREIRKTFQKQLDYLKEKEQILNNTKFQEIVANRPDTSSRNIQLKRLFTAVSVARRIREKDLENL